MTDQVNIELNADALANKPRCALENTSSQSLSTPVQGIATGPSAEEIDQSQSGTGTEINCDAIDSLEKPAQSSCRSPMLEIPTIQISEATDKLDTNCGNAKTSVQGEVTILAPIPKESIIACPGSV